MTQRCGARTLLEAICVHVAKARPNEAASALTQACCRSMVRSLQGNYPYLSADAGDIDDGGSAAQFSKKTIVQLREYLTEKGKEGLVHQLNAKKAKKPEWVEAAINV